MKNEIHKKLLVKLNLVLYDYNNLIKKKKSIVLFFLIQ